MVRAHRPSYGRHGDLLRLVVSSGRNLSGCLHKGLNSIVALTAWAIWKHHNTTIFDGIYPLPKIWS